MKRKRFTFEGGKLPVTFAGREDKIAEGVTCDTYTFDDDPEKDLAIITIDPGCKTPLQEVLQGIKTIEGHLSGRGELTIISRGGHRSGYVANDYQSSAIPGPISVEVKVGEKMQWAAAEDSTLVVSEVCFPPYKKGRYRNIEE